jgi:dTMP kinase
MKFIVFEGLDGSGKSSLIASLETILNNYRIPYVRSREPGGTPLGDEIRELLLRTDGEAPTPRTELLLYEASRAQHVDRFIKPNLESGKWVLCDRFSASSIAFQAGGRQISEEWVELLNRFATSDLEPDLTVLLDLSVAEAKRRRERRSLERGATEDRIESEADQFHDRVRQSFLKQAYTNPEKWLILDAGKPHTELVEELYAHLKDRGWLS